ncbi:DUF4097 family beta strand repeat protein [Vagococcus sp. BWB3-3]|uniref:DUF4097 family beta strand repeat protein n=1 Tax=Vagococcus allomyrinae TaxID=2794353 RepID=A0A940SVQ1_9ENTE|nr:DUF4097 family beta strand repeat-containing protein [Vagococcus allomyrinae]MBP1040558.1 DUF4097 family beta strand repeat protein [Vagococcus allomyrinae]
MNTIDAYLAELKSYFSESNMDVYLELEEDLLEEIQNSMAEGETEEEAVRKLSSPAEIASDFFADRRFETAQSAVGDLVPEDDVAEVFKEARRKRLTRSVQKGILISKKALIMILLALDVFLVTYIGQELYFEGNLARIPLIMCLFSLVILVNVNQLRRKLTQRRRFFVMSLCGLLGAVFLIEGLVNHHLFYQGISHFQEITADGTENLSFSLDSDAVIEITTSEVGPNEAFRVLFDGNFKKQDIQAIAKNNGQKQMNLRVDKKSLFNLFTRTKESEIILLIPKGTKLNEFNLDLLKGDLRLLHMAVKTLSLDLVEGDVFSKGIQADDVRLTSQKGDVVIEGSQLNGRLKNREGKTILTDLAGDLAITGDHGHTIIKEFISSESDVRTVDGKITMEDSQVAKLTTFSESGQNVVARTTGELNLASARGKIVSESNQGKLSTKNDSGVTIVIDTEGMPGEVVSESGFIKWIHDTGHPAQFSVSSQGGDIRNELTNLAGASGPLVSIHSVSGDVRVIEKVN